MRCKVLISILFICALYESAVAATSATVTPSLSKSATRNFKMIKDHIDFGTLTPGKTVSDTFAFQMLGTEVADLKMELRAACLTGDKTNHELKYGLSVSQDKGAEIRTDFVNAGVINTLTYQLKNSLCLLQLGEEPTLIFTMTIDGKDISAAAPDIYNATLTFEIESI